MHLNNKVMLQNKFTSAAVMSPVCSATSAKITIHAVISENDN